MKLEAGQKYQYKGDIKSFPKEVEVIQVKEQLKLKATKKSAKYKERDTVGVEKEYESPVGEVHSTILILNHEKDWKLK